MNKHVTLTIAGATYRFNLNLEDYNALVDESSTGGNGLVGPTHNYLMHTVHQEDKAALKELLQIPGAILQVAAKLNTDYVPELEIEVGE